jgi:hypothetical protein
MMRGLNPVQMELTTDTQKQTASSEKGSTSANTFFVGGNNNIGGYLDNEISEEHTAFIFSDSEVPEECHGWSGRRPFHGWLEGMADQTHKFKAGQSGEGIQKV